MTYFQSLEEIREWVLLHEKDIDTAYDTMVAIKALWNDGYNQAMVDAAVPPGETPRPSGFIGEDAGDLSVATEELREEPPDYSTESRDPPYGITEEEHRREGEAAFPDQTPDELVPYDEAPNENTPYPELYIGQPLVSGTRYRVGDQVMMHVTPNTINRETRTIDLTDSYKAILTLDPNTNRYKCGPIEFTDDVVHQRVAHTEALRSGILHNLKQAMPLLVVAGCHREFVHWCDQHGYQWMSLYGKVFPYAKYVSRPEEIAGYDNREQRIRFVGNYRESDAFHGLQMEDLWTHLTGSSDPDLRSHIEGDGFHSDSERNQSTPDAAERYSNRYGERIWEQLTGQEGVSPSARWMEAAAERLNSDEPPAEGTYTGQLSPPLTLEEVEGAMRYLRRYGVRGIPLEAEPTIEEQAIERTAAARRMMSDFAGSYPSLHHWHDEESTRFGRIYQQGMNLADYTRALREAGEITDELAEQMIADYIRSVGGGEDDP